MSERQVGDFLAAHLSALAGRFSGHFERVPSGPGRDNLFLTFDDPVVTLSTHIDTVPPFFASHEDADSIWGRGSCDAKGIAAAMILAAESLLTSGMRNLALLLVVGEERDSAGAKTMAASPRGSRFLINGEPTENQLALGSKGALRYELIAHGKLAHSAYPELGDSAIHALLDVLRDIRSIPLSENSLLGPTTLNIGVISGGRAPNVIADEARAEIMFRIVDDPASSARGCCRCFLRTRGSREVLFTPAIRLTPFDGLPKTIVAFTTDIPFFQGAWGKPFLIGPGSIHVAHTTDEHIPKKQLVEAVRIYSHMIKQLLEKGTASV